MNFLKCEKCEANNQSCDGTCLKNIFKNALMFLVIVFLILLVGVTYKGLKYLSNVSGSTRTIQITGIGEVEATPDISEITFSLKEINNSTDKSKNIEIQNKITKQMDNLMVEFQKLNISKKDIKTTNYSVNPKYEYTNCYGYSEYKSSKPCVSKNILSGYEISQSLTVKVRETENTGKVLAILTENKVTEVDGPNFKIEDTKKLKIQARDLAIADAKAKAKSLSKSLGVEIEDIISFYENSNPEIYPYMMSKSMAISAMVTEEAVADVNVQAGSEKVTSNVTITFKIDD